MEEEQLSFSNKFKAKIAIEALCGRRALTELELLYRIDINLMEYWSAQLES